MTKATKFLMTVLCFGMLSACGTGAKKDATPPKTEKVALGLPATIEDAVSQTSYRTETNIPRDQYRHPVETLKFFGIEPQMTVVEIAPGGGWYMEILAPLLATHGHYVAGAPAPSPEDTMATESYSKVSTWLKEHPEAGTNAKIAIFSPPAKIDLGPEKSADAVLTFRNVHNWVAKSAEKAAFRSFFKVLKPGGILGVVEHRADAKAKRDPKAKSGYVREADVIRMAESAGFKLVAKSEINANPKDTKNYPEGVWTLPPTLKLKEQDKAKYLEIGESDRMTLKFVRPLK